MIDNSVIKDNWAYIYKKGKMLSWNKTTEILRDGDVPLTGKFYGTKELLDRHWFWAGKSYKGTPRLFLRPFIFTEFDNPHIVGVYIDLKRYRFTEEGMVPDTKYEAPIYIIVK